MMANYIFRNYLTEKDKVLALANSMLEAHIGDTESREDHTETLRCKRAELEKLNTKLDNFIEMRAEGEISKELFKKKTSELELTIHRKSSRWFHYESAVFFVPIKIFEIFSFRGSINEPSRCLPIEGRNKRPHEP